MRVRIVVILGLAVLAAAAAVALVVRGGGGEDGGGRGEGGAAVRRPIGAAGAQPAARAIEAAPQLAPFDDDPPGALRLEGQVIDHADRPVGEATVVIDANPPREARTEADGSFALMG